MWSLFLHLSGDLGGPPFICGCPVNNPACSQLLTCLAQQSDALLTYLAALMLPALFPRTCLAISLMVDYFGFEPWGTWPPAWRGAVGASVPPGPGSSLHQASCSGQPQTASQHPCCQISPSRPLCQDSVSSLSLPAVTLPIPAHCIAAGERACVP